MRRLRSTRRPVRRLHRTRRPALGLAATLVLVLSAVAAAASSSQARGAGVRHSGAAVQRRGAAALQRGRRVVGETFRPRVGDWDGIARGFPASFELLRESSYPKRYGRPPYGFEDVVLFKPSSCPLNPFASFETSEQAGVTPVATNGLFGLAADGIPGGLIGARRAVLSSAFSIPSSPGSPGCQGRLKWHLHPALRRKVSDGVWRLDFAGGQSGTFTVSEGGRLANDIVLPAAIAGACGGASGAVSLFVASSGTARWSDPQQPGLKVSLTFTGKKSARGHISLAATSPCPSPVEVTMTGSLSRPGP